MRRHVLVLIVALVVLAGGAGAGVWWFGIRPAQQIQSLTERVVAGLASGELSDADLTAPAADELKRVYTGMGPLRPQVRLLGEPRAESDGTLRARLAWSWEVHPGKQTWQYETTLTLRRGEDGYRAEYQPGLVAPGLAPKEALRATRQAATRGAILGQGGEPLASNTLAWRLGIDKTLTDPATAAASAAKLAEAAGLDVPRFVERVEKAGARAFIEARILRRGEPADQELVRSAKAWIGVRAIETTFPLGRSSTFARPLLGVVGDATAEQVEGSGGTIRAGDLVGRGGLQEARNHVLAGTSGFVIAIVDADGSAREAFKVAALPGADVQTTIDVRLQTEAEAILAAVAPASALVAIRPSDGAVLVAASGPGGGGLSTATLGQYPPGSTFKSVTSLALARAGIGPDAPVDCSDGVVVDGYRFDNWKGYPAAALGRVPLHTALAFSCNSAFINERGRITQQALAEAAGSLGLTAEPNLVIGGFLGRVPDKAANETEHAASMIGQGKVVASPLGTATVMASAVASRTVAPVLVVEPGRTAPAPAVPLTPDEAAGLRTLLANTPREGGYASVRGIDGVLAKTGTATYAPERYHGWLIAARGDLAVAAFIAEGSSGGTDAGPLAAALLRAAG